MSEQPTPGKMNELTKLQADIIVAARLFHERYEALAPVYGYRTRPESAKPWAGLPENLQNLMMAVTADVCGPMLKAVANAEAEVTTLRSALLDVQAIQNEYDSSKAGLIPVGGWMAIRERLQHTDVREALTTKLRAAQVVEAAREAEGG